MQNEWKLSDLNINWVLSWDSLHVVIVALFTRLWMCLCLWIDVVNFTYRLCSILWIKSENRADILGRHKLSILSTLSTLTFIRLNLNIYFTDDKYTVHLVYTAVELFFFLYLTLYRYYNGIESVCETIKKKWKQSNVVRLKNVTHFPALGVCYLLSVKNLFTKSYTFDTSPLLFPFFWFFLEYIWSSYMHECNLQWRWT